MANIFLSTSDKNLSAEDVALGYKQLMEVERAFRTLKSTLSLRPVNYTRSDRIRSHVMLCWLALLLVGGDPAERAVEGSLVTGFENRDMMGDDPGGEVVMDGGDRFENICQVSGALEHMMDECIQVLLELFRIRKRLFIGHPVQYILKTAGKFRCQCRIVRYALGAGPFNLV